MPTQPTNSFQQYLQSMANLTPAIFPSAVVTPGTSFTAIITLTMATAVFVKTIAIVADANSVTNNVQWYMNIGNVQIATNTAPAGILAMLNITLPDTMLIPLTQGQQIILYAQQTPSPVAPSTMQLLVTAVDPIKWW